MLKKKRFHEFFVGEKIDIKFTEGNKRKDYRGTLTDFADDGVYLSSFNKRDTRFQYISINTIISVHKLLRESRLISGIIAGVSLAATIILISALNKNNNNAADNYGFILVIFPITGTTVGGISFLSTFITEAVNTRSVKRSWHFSLQ